MFKKSTKIFTGLFAVLIWMTLSGCATSSNELDMKKFGPKERVYFGRLFVDLNGNTHPRCEVYVNWDLAPNFKITEDNLIFYRTDRKEPELTKIACYHESSIYYAAWHMQQLNLTKLAYTDSNNQAVYFGDIHVVWKIDEKDTVDSAEKAPFEESSPKRIGHVKDSGVIKVTVDSQYSALKDVFKSRAPGLELTEKLVSIKKD